MNREEAVLAAMSPADGRVLSPVQIQKLMFLLDENIPAYIDGPHFSFVPYDYGPFDHNVYRAVERLSEEGLAEIIGDAGNRWRRYRLTPAGQREGEALLAKMPDDGQSYVRELVTFIREASFADLVSAVYAAYPDMKVNSVFES